MASRAVSLAKQVEALRGLVEQHLARAKPHCCVQVIYSEETPADEIEALKLAAAAEKGVEPDQVTLWLMIQIVKPKPCIEPPSPLRSGPYAELPDNTLAEPRKRFERDPTATVVEPAAPVRTERPERPMELDYPDAGTWK